MNGVGFLEIENFNPYNKLKLELLKVWMWEIRCIIVAMAKRINTLIYPQL